MFAEIANHGIHERFKTHDAALRVVLDDGALHPGVFGLVSGAEQMIGNLAIDDGAVVVVEFCLLERESGSDIMCYSGSPWSIYLSPFSISAIEGLDDFRNVKVKSVGSNSNNRAILFVELLDLDMVAPLSDSVKTPEVGPAYMKKSSCQSSSSSSNRRPSTKLTS